MLRGLRRRALLPALACLLALTSGGCAAGGSRAEAKLPAGSPHSFDLVRGEELGLVDYAQRKLRNNCLASAGYPQNQQLMAPRKQNLFGDLAPTASSLGPTSEDEARRRGFGRDADAQPARIVSFDPNYDRNLVRCSKLAWEKLGKDGAKTYHAYFDLVNAIAAPMHDRTLERLPPDLHARTYDCLARAGHRAPDRATFLKEPNPQKQLGIALGALSGPTDTWQPTRTRGTVQIGPPIPARRYLPTPAESALAVAYYRCDRETGRTKALLAASAVAQRELVDQHEQEFVELNRKVDALARTAARQVGAS